MLAKRRELSRGEEKEAGSPPEKKARTRTAGPLHHFLTLLLLDRPHKTCTYVDPMLDRGKIVTKSVNLSVVALLTCAKYKIPIEALMTSWWSTIARAKAIYWVPKIEVLATCEKIRYMWHELQRQNQMCYDALAGNFLYDLHIFGRCQCSCGTIAMREIMLQVDPSIKTWYVRQPAHVLLGAPFDVLNPKPVMIESTGDLNIEFEEPFVPETNTNYRINSVAGIEGFHAIEWLYDAQKSISWDPETKTPKTKEVSWEEQVQLFAQMSKAAHLIDVVPQDNLCQFYFFKFLLLCQYKIHGPLASFQALRESLETMCSEYLAKYDRLLRRRTRYDITPAYDFWFSLLANVKRL